MRASNKEIKLLTLNCFLRPPFVSRPGGEDKDNRAKFISEKIIPKYSILTFQEVFGTFSSKRRRILLRDAEKLGFEGVYIKLGPRASFSRGLKFMDGGLLILTKFPIVETGTLYYKNGCSSDKLAAKGVLYAKLNIDEGKNLHVFTTHTQASYHYKATEQDVRIRKKQLTELVNFIQEKIEKAPDDPVVVTGDFNMDNLQEDCPEYDHLVETLNRNMRFIDAVLETKGKHIPTSVHFKYKTMNGEEVGSSLFRSDAQGLLDSKNISEIKIDSDQTFWARQCLDYIFVKESQKLKVADTLVMEFVPEEKQEWRQVSDHCGLELKLHP
mmetsp:Transcript_11484/g.14976  ORF Transcript_11484/g.14976 Transcript_11484/m.14976 type:complete len:326 (+) Transcript_11484:118-1095(+)